MRIGRITRIRPTLVRERSNAGDWARLTILASWAELTATLSFRMVYHDPWPDAIPFTLLSFYPLRRSSDCPAGTGCCREGLRRAAVVEDLARETAQASARLLRESPRNLPCWLCTKGMWATSAV